MNTRSVITCLLLAAAVPVAAGTPSIFDGVDIEKHTRDGGPPPDGIPAMNNPDFAPPSQITYVQEDDLVVGVFRNGVAKAYPENLAWWHEIINDEIGGQFITVSLCPLTGTPMVFDATAEDGTQLEFGVSGLLINSNLMLYDRRDNFSLYPQMTHTAINGTYEGEELALLPAVETTYANWKRMYPDTEVVQFGTGLETYHSTISNYYKDVDLFNGYPYGDYRTNHDRLLFPTTTNQPDLSSYLTKEMVLGICLGDGVSAYPYSNMGDAAVLNDVLGGQELVVVYDAGTRTAIPFSRRVGGRTLTFYQVEAAGPLPVEFRDVETGTLWDLRGEAMDGELIGARLEQLPAHTSMWFAWSTFWPQTAVWDGGGILEAPPITAVLEPRDSAVPESFALGQSFPNPFNPDTRIQFSLPHEGEVSLRIYNGVGQLVRSLADGNHRAGLYLVPWDGRDDAGRGVATGTYFYRLEMAGRGLAQTRSMTLAR